MSDSNFGFPGNKRWRSRLSLLKSAWAGEDEAEAESETEEEATTELPDTKAAAHGGEAYSLDAQDSMNYRQILDSKGAAPWQEDESGQPIQNADIMTPFSREAQEGVVSADADSVEEWKPVAETETVELTDIPEPVADIFEPAAFDEENSQHIEATSEQKHDPAVVESTADEVELAEDEQPSETDEQTKVYAGFVRLTSGNSADEVEESTDIEEAPFVRMVGDSDEDLDIDGESIVGEADSSDAFAPPDGIFASDENTLIDGQPEPLVVIRDDAADPNKQLEDDLPAPRLRPLKPAASQKDKHTLSDLNSIGDPMVDSTDSKMDLKSMSRMSRLKPKSANSLTGAPPPQLDAQVEDSVLAPESNVLLIATHAPERNTFRTYLRRHDIPCRAAISPENALAVILEMKPAAVLLSGSGLNPDEILTLIDDINDTMEAPVLALLTESQIKMLSNDLLSAHVLQYPASLRQIRSDLTRILVEEGNAKPRCSLRQALLPK